jgi:hypothetical protein
MYECAAGCLAVVPTTRLAIDSTDWMCAERW